jgi:uncharacterized protein (DUF983 family)
MPKPSRIRAILTARCPHCLEGEVFTGWWDMRETCPLCGVVYKREEGYFMNAIFVGYVLGFFAIVPPLLILYFMNASVLAYTIAASVVLAILAPLILRYARILWMHMDELMDPRQPGRR